jgi:hypothetical protein
MMYGAATGRSRTHVPGSWLLRLAIAGCLAACAVASPASAAPSWLPPLNLPGVKKGAETPQVAVDSQGNATAIWRRWSGEKLIVESAVRRVGKGWAVPVTLDVDAGGGYESSQSPQVAVDPAGTATAVWERRLGGRTFVIQSATRPAGGSWSASVDISAVGRAGSSFHVALDPQGSVTAVWEAESKGTIQSATRPAGGNWSAPVDISAAGAFAHAPQVAVDSEGNATAVWERYNPQGTQIQSATRPAGGSWSAPANLFEPRRIADRPQVAVDPHGNATAIWLRSDGNDLLVQGATRPAGGSWSVPVDISADDGRGGDNARLVVDSRGNATAVWRGYDSNRDNFAIQAATRPLGGGWSPPTDVSNRTRNGTSVSEPQVAVDPLGNATVAWLLGSQRGAVIQSATSVSGRAYAARVVRVRGGRASIALRCEHGGRCGGVIRLKAGGKSIAARRFAIAEGRSKVIRVKLYPQGLRLLAESRRPLWAKLVGRGIKNRTVLLK